MSSPSTSVLDYLEISPAVRKSTSSRAVSLLIDTPSSAYSDPSYTVAHLSKLVKAIVTDLASTDCGWNGQECVAALQAVKELSRRPGSSETMGGSECLNHLTSLARRELSALPSSSQNATSITAPSKDGPSQLSREKLDLVLRILNNVLLQHPETRIEFARPSMGGLKVALELLECHQSAEVAFLSARLVFFCTLFEAEATRSAVENMHLVEIFAKRTDALVQGKITSEADVALAELQKAFFNVGLYYPRLAKNELKERAIVGEKFHERLLPFLAPTIRLIVSHPSQTPTSLAPPLTNAIAVLLNYPVGPYRQIWSDPNLLSTQHTKKTSSGSDDSSQNSWSASTSKAKRMATSLFGKSSASYSSSSGSSMSSAPHKQGSNVGSATFIETLVSLLDDFLQRYFTTADPDDNMASSLAKSDNVDLQDYAEPALLLCRRLVDEVVDFRRVVKGRLLPSDIDRSQGLNTRMDLTGTMIRLMSSTLFPRLARASGEVLLALCDGQPTKMTAEIGYGPCAGFLAQIGQIHSLPGAATSNGSGQVLDPITGKVLPSAEEMAREDEAAGTAMTEEEKEAEAEKLFSLFDRLDRTGVVKVQNPVRQGVESGRIQELEEEEEKRVKEEEEEEDRELETTVEREMKAFRERQNRSRD